MSKFSFLSFEISKQPIDNQTDMLKRMKMATPSFNQRNLHDVETTDILPE